jgi:hypothetical protein
MSATFITFTCDTCNYIGASSAVWGVFAYESPSGYIDVNRELGWCYQCEDLAPIEVIPSLESIQDIEHEIEKGAQQLHEIKNQAREGRSFLKKLLHLPAQIPDDGRMIEAVRKHFNRELEEEHKRSDLLKGRKSKPRCLSCGSERCFVLPGYTKPAGSDEYPGEPVSTGIKHPNCGGDLMAQYSGIRASMIFERRIYDKEGCLIRTEDMEEQASRLS